MNKPAAIVEGQEEPARFSVDEYVAMIEAGAFHGVSGKIELAEGVIVRMSPPHQPHFWLQRQLFRKLDALFGDGIDGWVVGQEPTVRIGEKSVRNPDVAVLRVPEHIVRKAIFETADVVFVAEVSDSTLGTDRGSKLAGYANVLIPHYWIVDVNGRRVFTLSEPANGKYEKDIAVAFGEPMIVPLVGASITIEYRP